MAKIVGNLRPEDDYTHPLGPEPNFNESMYFNFFDPKQEVGGFVRLGNRANEGNAEMTVCLYLADGRVLSNPSNAELAAASALYNFFIDLLVVERSVNWFSFLRTPQELQQWFERLESWFAEHNLEPQPQLVRF